MPSKSMRFSSTPSQRRSCYNKECSGALTLHKKIWEDGKSFRRMSSYASSTTSLLSRGLSSLSITSRSIISNSYGIKNRYNTSYKESQKQASDNSWQVSSIESIPADAILANKCLGSGSFASVYSIASIRSKKKDKNGKFILCDKKRDVYALKCLHRDTLQSAKKTKMASNDLKTEVGLLSCLPTHENIVQIHAVSEGFFDCPAQGFFVLDRLTDTLSDRLNKWRDQLTQDPTKTKSPSRLSLILKNPMDRQYTNMPKSLEHSAWQQNRVEQIGVGLAKAMEFLHEHKVLYRDLKAGNVGFDSNGNVRLFDFGLSKKVEVDEHGIPIHRFTMCVGTPRYMAPEVATSTRYDFSSDVYSFTVLLWEVITLRKPYGKPESLKHLIEMVRDGTRPSISSVGSSNIRKLLTDGWSPQPSVRPPMTEIVKRLTDAANPRRILQEATQRIPAQRRASAAA